MPELIFRLYFFGLMIFVPNSATSPDSIAVYLVDARHDGCASHTPFVGFVAEDPGSCPPRCAYEAGAPGAKPPRKPLCGCILDGDTITFEPEATPVVHHLKAHPTHVAAGNAAEAGGLEWMVNMNNVGQRYPRLKTDGKFVGQLRLSWDVAQTCELASHLECKPYPNCTPVTTSYSFEEVDKPQSHGDQALAQAVMFEARIPFGRLSMRLHKAGLEPVTITIPCSGNECDVGVVNSRYDPADLGTEGTDFFHYLAFLRTVSVTVRPVVGDQEQATALPACPPSFEAFKPPLENFLTGHPAADAEECLFPVNLTGRPICPMVVINE